MQHSKETSTVDGIQMDESNSLPNRTAFSRGARRWGWCRVGKRVGRAARRPKGGQTGSVKVGEGQPWRERSGMT